MTFDIERMVDAYMACAEWADKPDGSNARFPKSEREAAHRDCEEFVKACGPLVNQAMQQSGYSAEQFGHDFWLTRCGHGAGFWDRDELKVTACANVPFIDRNSNQYRACTVDDECTLGDALNACAYGTDKHISRFAYANIEAYRGWLYFY